MKGVWRAIAPTLPCALKRSTHLATLFSVVLNRPAPFVRAPSTTSRIICSRPFGVGHTCGCPFGPGQPSAYGSKPLRIRCKFRSHFPVLRREIPCSKANRELRRNCLNRLKIFGAAISLFAQKRRKFPVSRAKQNRTARDRRLGF